MGMYHCIVFIGLILLGGSSVSAQEDACYREGTNCDRQGQGNEIGHTPYFPDIWACELACRDTQGCSWFTFYENSDFYMCYLLTACDSPSMDDHAISGMIDECTEDTTPTRIPTWVSDKSE